MHCRLRIAVAINSGISPYLYVCMFLSLLSLVGEKKIYIKFDISRQRRNAWCL